MTRFYTPILLLQGFCIYHAYQNKAEYYWYWIIIFFPVIGCLIYLYKQFYSTKNIDQISEGLTQLLNQDHQVQKLEKVVNFSPTVSNKMSLADLYLAKGEHESAKELYESCLDDVHGNDLDLIKKLITVNYLTKDYKSVIRIANQIEDQTFFRNTEERIALAWSFFHEGNTEAAENHFIEMDAQFSNYPHRLEYGKFLGQLNRKEEAKAKFNEMLDEIQHMDPYEKRLKKEVYKAVNNALRDMEK